MYAARTWTKLLKRHLLGSGKFTFQRWQQTAVVVAQEPFLNGSSSNYVEEMYLSWKEDPKSVHRVGTVTKFYMIVQTLDISALKQQRAWDSATDNEMYRSFILEM